MTSILVLTLVSVFAVACDGGGGAPLANTPTAVVATATPMAMGFLPRPTPDPGYSDRCLAPPGGACLTIGARFNPYRDLGFDRAVYLYGHYGIQPDRFVTDQGHLTEILQELDTQVAAEPITIDDLPFGDEEHFYLHVVWPECYVTGGPLCGKVFTVDFDEYLLGERGEGLQWRVPPEFARLLVQHLTEDPPTPTVTPGPTPTIVPAGAVFFGQPEQELRWDGPDDGVRSLREAHCGNPELLQQFGVPAHIGSQTLDIGFWSTYAVPREDGWRWTGYYHGDWQIWRGDDPLKVYLVYGPEPRIAFEYMSYGCI